MGRPFLAPPGIPADRLETLRKAFMDTMADKTFLEEAEKGQMEITPVSGADLQTLVTELYATPATVTQKAAEMLK
jgi:tripartite-type tricarboxylate transporter receptor subunit TctC